MVLTVYDYTVFIVFLAGCSFMPIYEKLCGPRNQTRADYVFAAGASVSMGAMMMSLARGTLGVRSFLGFPSELVYRGSGMWETLYGIVLAYPIISYVFVPVYYNLGITSIYQYLDLRFRSRSVRCLASLTYVARSLLTTGLTVFIPCIALKTIMGFPYWASICSIGGLSILLNLMGGLKSAIHADVVQGIAMLCCSLAILIHGTISAGGVAPVVKLSHDRGRLNFLDFNVDPRVRVSTFSAIFGQVFISLSIFGCQQNFVQRYCSMSSQRAVTRTLMYHIPVIAVLYSVSWVVGMVIFAIYADCDPLALGLISKIDEVVPLYIEDKFEFVPGFTGLLIAVLFNGALSIVMSNLNSLATVTWEDFFKMAPSCGKLSEERQLMAIRFIGTLYGLTAIMIALGVGSLSGVIDSSKLIASATSGPLLGVFLMAMLLPCVNWKGAAGGMILGHAFTLWMTLGGMMLDRPPPAMLPLSTTGCTNTSFSLSVYKDYTPHRHNTTIHEEVSPSLLSLTLSQTTDILFEFYSISYMYYALLGCGVTVGSGVAISYLTGTSDDDLYDEKLIHPLAAKISQWLPGKPRRFRSDHVISNKNKEQSNTNDIIISTITINSNISENIL